MARLKVALVGLGAIGSSIGLALRRTEADLEIIGHDKDPLAARQAQKMGAVHRTHWNLISTCEGADLVVLSIPLPGIRDTLKSLAPYLREGCVITDTATVKAPVMEWAEELLPEGVFFVGGDPIVSMEESGGGAATAELFQGATWVMCTAKGTVSEAIQLVSDLVSLLGAKPYFMDAAEHDSLQAATDHLPLVMGAALLNALGESPALREMSKVGGKNLAHLTAPTTADVASLRDIAVLNRDSIARWLGEMEEALHQAREIIARGDREQVEAFFTHAQESRARWLAGEREDAPASELRNFSFGSMFLGRISLKGPRTDRSAKKA